MLQGRGLEGWGLGLAEPFSFFFGFFFSYFQGPNLGWGILYFFVIFSYSEVCGLCTSSSRIAIPSALAGHELVGTNLWWLRVSQKESCKRRIAKIIECLRGQHRGERNSTSFLRFSRPFSVFRVAKWAFLYFKTCTPVKGTPWRTASKSDEESDRSVRQITLLQKESCKTSLARKWLKVTEASAKVTKVTKNESDRTPFADLLLRHPECYPTFSQVSLTLLQKGTGKEVTKSVEK